MIDRILIRPQPAPAQAAAGYFRLHAIIEGCPAGPGILWYDIEADRAPVAFPEVADSYVLALVFPAMRRGLPIHVAGKVSLSLLENLDRFMTLWEYWCPGTYRKIAIDADMITDTPATDGRGILLFSGGVDSCFALLKHHRKLLGRRSRRIEKAVLVHGADFASEADIRADAATGNARELAADLGVEICVVRSNFREFGGNWEHSHGACLVSCLHWFSEAGGHGIIGSSVALPNVLEIWGTHPLTDHLLGSRKFSVDYDTATHVRAEKIEMVATWPAAMKHLRVCYSNRTSGEYNCRKCRKCVLTALAFLACGREVETLERTLTSRKIFQLWNMPRWAENEVIPILRIAKKNNVHLAAPFLALRLVVLFNIHIYHFLKRSR